MQSAITQTGKSRANQALKVALSNSKTPTA